MTREQANEIVANLQGWENPTIEENQYGDIWVEATDPTTGRRMEYNASTGMFE